MKKKFNFQNGKYVFFHYTCGYQLRGNPVYVCELNVDNIFIGQIQDWKVETNQIQNGKWKQIKYKILQ